MAGKFLQSFFQAIGFGEPVGKFYLNDPTTPHLMKNGPLPSIHGRLPDFNVVGWKGVPSIDIGSDPFRSSQVYFTITKALSLVNKVYGRDYINKWSSTSTLVAIPKAGLQFNAFYDRTTLRFFYAFDEFRKKMIHSCEAVDVVAHELGHAVLDAVRPDIWSAMAIEMFAFHEAFGDILAFSTLVTEPLVVEEIIKETGGNFKKPSCASRIGEELGAAIFRASKGKVGTAEYLRCLVNSFTYMPAEELSSSGGDNVITKSPHSFGRIFSGAWYDCVIASTEKLTFSGKSPQDALVISTEKCLAILLKAVLSAMSNTQFMKSVAKTFLDICYLSDPDLFSECHKVFTSRKLVSDYSPQQMGFTNNPSMLGFIDTVELDPDIEGNKMRVKPVTSIVGCSEVIVDIPMYVSQSSKHTVESTVCDCLSFIQDEGLVGDPAEFKMFSILNGKVERNFICGCRK